MPIKFGISLGSSLLMIAFLNIAPSSIASASPQLPVFAPQKSKRQFYSLRSLRSSWGAKTFRASAIPSLSYKNFGHLTPKGIRNIKRFIHQIETKKDSLILFRGQKKIHSRLSQMPKNPSAQKRQVASELSTGKQIIDTRIENNERHDSIARLTGNMESHLSQKQLYQEVRSLDAIIHKHQSSSGSHLMVSATRSLSVAAGDYNMRNTDNRNRYIYILSAPTKQLVNIYATDLHKGKRFRKGRPNKNRSDFAREQEFAIWKDATPYITGIYDTHKDKFIKQRHSK